MPRKRIVWSPDSLVHVTSRGNRRQPIFRTHADAQAFVALLAWVIGRYQWVCLAYCLMGNHFHLFLRLPEDTLSEGMRYLKWHFTQTSNGKYGETGHVFEGRFPSILVEDESHLVEVCRYVVLNPVRAGLVAHPADWKWSSYLATAGEIPVPGWLAAGEVLSHFQPPRGTPQAEYRRFVEQGIDLRRPMNWSRIGRPF